MLSWQLNPTFVGKILHIRLRASRENDVEEGNAAKGWARKMDDFEIFERSDRHVGCHSIQEVERN